MTKIRTLFFTLAAALVVALLALPVTPAQAQATRTWVSGVGDDANPCSRTAPCKTFAGAISKTAAGGEINCLDPGGFGAVTIGKSLSIVCDYTEGGVLVSGTNAIIVSAPANSIVTLKGIDIECNGTGINGIEMINVGVTLHVHKVQIRNCRGGNGILVAPSSGLAEVYVADSYITDNGAGNPNAGILVRPTAGATANVSVKRVHLENNTNGIFMDNGGGGGAANVNVDESVLSGSSNTGIVVSQANTATVVNSMMSFNVNTGAATSGSGTIKLAYCTVANNVNGVIGNVFGTTPGTNVISGNSANETIGVNVTLK